MSFQCMVWAIEQKLPTYEKFVLIMLANYADEKNSCWPSIDTIAENTGLSKSTVLRTVKSLSEKGYLKVGKRRVQSRGFNSNFYTLPAVMTGKIFRIKLFNEAPVDEWADA